MRISIITVCLNSKKTIETAIKSVLRQEYDDLEYIIIDGGSTDGTQDIVKKYQADITRFVSEPDKGLYDAMNKGIRLASGEVIGILNSDDWYEKDTLRIVASGFSYNKHLEVLYGDVNIVKKLGISFRLETFPFVTLWRLMSVNHPAAFVRKSAYEKYGLFDTSYKIAADADFMNRIWHCGAAFGHINEVLTNFAQEGISSTRLLEREAEEHKFIERFFRPDLFIRGCYEKLREKGMPVLLVGTGYWSPLLLKTFLDFDIPIGGVFDPDPLKWGQRFMGQVVQPPNLLKHRNGTILVSAMEQGVNIINSLLNEHYIPRYRILPLWECFEEYEQLFGSGEKGHS